jgi:CHC2 zinc finger/Toprim-like
MLTVDNETDLEELKDDPSAFNLYQSRLDLRRQGSEYIARCPFHVDKNPSFHVNRKAGRWLWNCFPCQRGGSIVDFVSEFDRLDVGDAIQTIKNELGNQTSRPSCKTDDYQKQQSFRTISLTEYAIVEGKLAANSTVQEWLLTNRGITYETAKRLHIGYRQKIPANESVQDILDKGWLCFPSIEDGRVVSLKYRSVVRKAFSRKHSMATVLFNTVTISPLEDLYVTAGEFDAAVLEQAGFHTVSLPSDSIPITSELIAKLKLGKRLILAGDSDDSGIRVMDKIQEKIPEALRLSWPDGIKDANQLWIVHRRNMAGFQKLICELTEKAAKAPVSSVESQDDDTEDAPDLIPVCPAEVIDGGYIGELARLLTDGTTIPPEFVWNNIAVLLGAMVDGRIGFKGHENIHTRFYTINVSNLPRSGKGESWSRTGDDSTGLIAGLLAGRGIKVMDGSLFGSGEFMVGTIAEWAKQVQKDGLPARVDVIARFDEMSEVFEKSKALGSTLTHKLLQMFERSTVSTGSFKNKEHHVHNLHFSISGDFTRDLFEKAFAGQGAGGSGLLSRFTYAFCKKRPYKGRWPQLDGIGIVKVITKIRECLERLGNENVVETANDEDWDFFTQPTRFIPPETPGAIKMCEEFLAELDREDENFTPEMPTHFKRYLLLQTIFSDNQVIDESRTKQAILWTRHQLVVRKVLWPEDGGNLVEQFERKILKALTGRNLSLSRLMSWCNVDRAGSGGRDVFLRALRALTSSGDIVVPERTRRGQAIYVRPQQLPAISGESAATTSAIQQSL